MAESKEEFARIKKKDIVNAYLKLFGEEQGRFLLRKLIEEKERIWEERHNKENA